MNATLLWTNPNPNVEFKQTTFDFDVSKYEYFLIEVKSRIDVAIFREEIFHLLIDEPNVLSSPFHNTDINIWQGDCRQRIITKTSSNKLSLSNGMLNGSWINNGYAIPIKIYGLKGKINGIK